MAFVSASHCRGCARVGADRLVRRGERNPRICPKAGFGTVFFRLGGGSGATAAQPRCHQAHCLDE